MQLHVMHSVTNVIQHCSVCATNVVINNAILAACDQCSKVVIKKLPPTFQPSLTSLGC